MTNLYGFQTAGRIFAGRGCLSGAGDILAADGARTAAVVTDPGITQAGLLDRLKDTLEGAGIRCAVYPDVVPEPPLDSVERLASKMRSTRWDIIVGIGGGSSMDAAKLVSVLMTNDESLKDLLGIGRIGKPGIPTALVPTTAGTGSEVTPNAIVTIPDEQRKTGVVSPYLFARYAFLDPLLTLGLPPASTASTGLDAFIHSLESYIGKKANPISDALALSGMRLISGAIRKAWDDGSNEEAREHMLIGSALGGMALTSAGTAAVHALAYPIGGRYGIPHGVANAMLLIPVLERNLPFCSRRLSDVWGVMELESGGSEAPGPLSSYALERAEAVLAALKALVRDLQIPASLREFGAVESDLPGLAASASKVTRLLDNNPVELSLPDMETIYRRLL